MHDVAVIIVNYNVKYFIKQCIESVIAASQNLSVQIVVVDNASVDGSVAMLQREFPDVLTIVNQDNVGFAKANNQGIDLATAKYTLLLNPDTLIEEDTLDKCYAYMESKPKVGALGVKLVDGTGKYLPESKRGFPTPVAAFFKFTGIYRLFPKSKTINAYYAGHLSSSESGPVDVLCGCFMFMRSDVLDDVGRLDEDYFMYGEDIDLSYCIQKAGYQNHYLPTTSIIHYKGESTKKHSRKYVTTFYGAMQIFINKHFTGRGSRLTVFWLNLAIVATSFLAYLKHSGGRVIRLLMDGGIATASISSLVVIVANVLYGIPDYYSNTYVPFTSCVIVGLLLVLYLVGHYDDSAKRSRFIPTVLCYLALVLVVYSLLPEKIRFSRLLAVASVLVPAIITFVTRIIFNRLAGYGFRYERMVDTQLILVGKRDSIESLDSIIHKQDRLNVVAKLSPDRSYDSTYYQADMSSIVKVIDIMNANEVLFCSRDMSMSSILQTMSVVGPAVRYRIANQSNDNVLGSDSKNGQGSWYTEEVEFAINSQSNRRLKRFVDVLIALVSVIAFPYMLLRSGKTRILMSNAIDLLIGRKTTFGYDRQNHLPVLHDYCFDVQRIDAKQLPAYHYAKEYSVLTDLSYIVNLIVYG